MDKYAEFIYKNKNGKKITFSVNSDFWLTDIDNISGNTIDVSTSKSINQIGSTLIHSTVQSKDISLNGSINGNLELNRKRLLSTIIPNDRGTLIYRRKNEEYYINCTPKQTPYIENGNVSQRLQIVLFCDFPYWRNTSGRIEYLSGLKPAFMFPVNYGSPHKFGERIKSEFINVVNNGNVDAGFTCVFKNNSPSDITNPSLLNVVTKEKMKINKVLKPNEELRFSTQWGNKRITSIFNDTETNSFKYRANNSVFFQLHAGDNILKDDADINDEYLDTYIIFDDTYAGV